MCRCSEAAPLDIAPPEFEIPPPAELDARPEPADSVEPAAAETDQVPEPAQLTLTEVASDDDLFDDPNLEVARLASGEAREIVIPVEVGDEATGCRRYKLSLKLPIAKQQFFGV